MQLRGVGQWQLALELFHRVTADSVAPNAAIFNAAMSACAQGCHMMSISMLATYISQGHQPHLAAAKRTSCQVQASRVSFVGVLAI